MNGVSPPRALLERREGEVGIFDFLPGDQRESLRAAETVCIVEASRDEYGPVKNASGDDSPESSRRALSQRYRRWIEDAGLRAPSPAHWIEIDESRISGPGDLRAPGISSIGDLPDHIHTRLGDDA